jgi:hypothetical protein
MKSTLISRAAGVFLWCVVSTSAAPAGAQLPPQKALKNIRAIVEKAIGAGPGTGVTVCTAGVLPQSGTTPATILTSVDSSGRGACNRLFRLSMGTPSAVLQQFETTWGITDLSLIISDLDHDGDPELLIPNEWGHGRHYHCEPTKIVIYKCDARTCSDESRRFPAFFEHEADRLSQVIERLARFSPGAQVEQRECLEMERDRLLRFLGLDPSAGLRAADVWMHDASKDVRLNAISVFADVGDAASQARLKALTDDEDSEVSAAAFRALRLYGSR